MIPHEILEFIQGRYSHRTKKKDQYGEVFTPIELVDELVSHIPVKWTDSNTKILDPASGIGNFPVVIYYKLMDSLSKTIPEKKRRSQHIINNMLFMVEIDATNVKQCRELFKLIDPLATPNISHCDFLQERAKWESMFDIKEWDIIVANPPYQSKQEKLREGGYGGKTIWDDFLTSSLELVKPGSGYLAFITPPAWRKPDAELYPVMTRENQLHYLHIYGKKAGKEYFQVQQRFDLFVVQKSPATDSTEVIDEKGKTHSLDLSVWPFLPNYALGAIKKVLTDKSSGIQVIYDRSSYGTDLPHMRSAKDATHKYPVVHSMNRNGIVYWYSNVKDRGHFGEAKVLLNFNEKLYPVLDYEGKYGMSQFTFGIPVGSRSEGRRMVEALESRTFTEIVKATKWGAFRTDWRMFCYFKPDFWKQFLGVGVERKTRKRGRSVPRKTRRVGVK